MLTSSKGAKKHVPVLVDEEHVGTSLEQSMRGTETCPRRTNEAESARYRGIQ